MVVAEGRWIVCYYSFRKITLRNHLSVYQTAFRVNKCSWIILPNSSILILKQIFFISSWAVGSKNFTRCKQTFKTWRERHKMPERTNCPWLWLLMAGWVMFVVYHLLIFAWSRVIYNLFTQFIIGPGKRKEVVSIFTKHLYLWYYALFTTLLDGTVQIYAWHCQFGSWTISL